MLTLDHIVATSRDADYACATWERLGFTLTPRGFHPFGTMNNLVVFRRTFYEFLSLCDPERFEVAVARGDLPPRLAALTRVALETRDGPSLLALTPEDPDADLAAVEARGIAVSEPMQFKRPVRLPDGRDTAAAVTVHFLDDPAYDEAPVFSSQQHVAGAIWVPAWQQHPNGALDICEAIYSAPRPRELAAHFVRLLGPPSTDSDDRIVFDAGPGRIVIGSPEWCGQRFADVGGSGFLPGAALEGLSIEIADLGNVEELLRKGGVPFALTNGAIQVGRDDAAGVLLEFSETTAQQT